MSEQPTSTTDRSRGGSLDGTAAPLLGVAEAAHAAGSPLASPASSGRTRPRLLLLLAVLAIGVAAFALIRLPQTGLHLMLLIGAVLQGATYLAAPLLALLAERDIRARSVDDRQLVSVPTQASLVPAYGVPSSASEDTARPPVLTR